MSELTKAELKAMGHEPMPVLKAIKAKCLDCSGGLRSEVTDCLVRTCALWPFRLGTNPWRAEVSEARRQSAREAFARIKSGTIPEKTTEEEAA